MQGIKWKINFNIFWGVLYDTNLVYYKICGIIA
jgi:hypothetical protein